MVEPIDTILGFHNALRNDMTQIDAAALNLARGNYDRASTLERVQFFNEVLAWHAEGEELFIFPALEEVAPLVAEAYVKDHRGLDVASKALQIGYDANDPLRTARASAAFRFHLNMHLDKEDTHLYRIFRERVPMSIQWETHRELSNIAPPERFPEIAVWLFELMDQEGDRENMVRLWQMTMSSSAFANVKGLIRQAVGSDWDELTRRIPTLDE